MEGDKPKRQNFRRYPIGFFHIDIAEVQTAEGKFYLFAEQPRNRNTGYSMPMRFDMICAANGIAHRLTKPNHPWTNDQVARMNRTIKDATVKRVHYDNHEQLRVHLAAYTFARRLKTLGGLTPYGYLCKIWTSEPDRFIVNPIHQMPGLNT